MKLKNKLLPLTGIAVATAAITPFVTSCNDTGYKGAWSWNSHDQFCVQTNPKEYTKYTYEEGKQLELVNKITSDYVEDINNDYNVFYDDFAWIATSEATKTTWQMLNCFIPTNMFMQLNNLSTYDIQVEDTEISIMLLSCTAHFEGFVLGNLESLPLKEQFTTCDFTLVNVPFINYAFEGNYFGFGIPTEPSIWLQIEDWSSSISIEQGGSTVLYDINPKNVVDHLIFPMLNPGDPEEIPSPSEYLSGILSIPMSYHFMYCEAEPLEP